jgi:cation transport regulator ChaB
MIFNNKNDKIGQQDMHQQYFASRGVKVKKFPATSNNRYQSHSFAAAELITHLTLYVDYMEWIKDGKEKPGFTNMERNVFLGLQDIPTQTELAVIVLYAQAVSHPYMRKVRGSEAEQINMLGLGQLHFQIQKHIEKVIETPSILLPPHGSYEHGTADGLSWEDPDAIEAISKLMPSLTHIKPLLVVFFKAALETWKRFTPEFQEGGMIAQLTPEEKKKAHRPPTNDHNEGALGHFRLKLRLKPGMSMHYYNALAMFKSNDTAIFVQQMFLKEDHVYVHEEARKRDSSHLEQACKAAITAFKNKQVADRRQKMAEKAQKIHATQERLAVVQRMDAVEDVTLNMTNAQLKDQLEIYRPLIDGIPLKSHLKTKADMIAALKEAITRYKVLQDMQNSES